MFTNTLAQITNPVIGNLGIDTKTSDSLADLIATIIRTLVVVGGIIMILYLIIGGITWITAEGKPDKLEKARNQIVQAITGMVILAAVVAISTLIGSLLGLNILDISIPTVGTT